MNINSPIRRDAYLDKLIARYADETVALLSGTFGMLLPDN